MTHPLIAALSQEHSAQALVHLGFDYVIQQPLHTWIQPEEVLNRVSRYFDLEQTGQLLERHLPALIEQVQSTLKENGETVHHWMTAEIDMELRSWAIKPIFLRPQSLNRWVHHEVVEEVMKALIQDILERFIQIAKPGGQGGGLLGMASRGAFGFANRASKGILGGISEQLEGHLKGLVSGFIQSSLHGILSQLVLIICAPELAPKLGKARLKLYEDLLKTPLADLMNQAQSVEMDEWSRLIPEWFDYHLNRPQVRSLVIEQMQNILDQEGHHPLHTFLGSAERVQAMKEEISQTLTPHIQKLSQSPAFENWVNLYVVSHSTAAEHEKGQIETEDDQGEGSESS